MEFVQECLGVYLLGIRDGVRMRILDYPKVALPAACSMLLYAFVLIPISISRLFCRWFAREVCYTSIDWIVGGWFYCCAYCASFVIYEEICNNVLSVNKSNRHRGRGRFLGRVSNRGYITDPVAAFADSFYRSFLTFAISLVTTLSFNWVGPKLAFVELALMISYYAAGYRWMTLKLSTEARIYEFDNSWVYYLGFGSPIALFMVLFGLHSTIFGPLLTAFVFPVLLVNSLTCTPVQVNTVWLTTPVVCLACRLPILKSLNLAMEAIMGFSTKESVNHRAIANFEEEPFNIIERASNLELRSHCKDVSTLLQYISNEVKRESVIMEKDPVRRMENPLK